jgi:hypothetical protein
MSAPSPPTPSPPTPPTSELRDLVAQAVSLDYLQYRQNAAGQEHSERKPAWLQLFESAGFAALVTVVIGGIAGGLITFELQEYARNRERQAADARLEHDRSMSAFKEHLDRERKVVDEMFLRLGKFVDASRDLSTLSRKEFCEKCDRGGGSKRNMSEVQAVVNRYNLATVDWNANRLRLGMLLQLEHNNDAALLKNWKETCDAAEAYAECADRWRTKYNNLEFHEALKACVEVRDSLDGKVQAFTHRIVELRNSSGDKSGEKSGTSP